MENRMQDVHDEAMADWLAGGYDDDRPTAAELADDGWDGEDPEGAYDDDGLTDAEADAMTLASAGMGTDEDYGFFGYDDEPF